ncbi:MAG: hypothetical protein SF162_04905 [bacterium]|nr:hypothetical protein [bacterium]
MTSLFILCALLAYFSPWVVNPASGLTFHGLDLAEWTSLHPLVRTESPALLTPLVLRLPLLCMGLVLGLRAPGAHPRLRMAHRIGALLIAFGLLPPLDFITQLDNLNYRQQFALAAIGMMGAGISLLSVRGSKAARHWRLRGAGLACGLAVVAGVTGVVRSYGLMQEFDLAAQFGIGALAFPVLCGLLAGSLVRNHWPDTAAEPKQGSTPNGTTLPPQLQ